MEHSCAMFNDFLLVCNVKHQSVSYRIYPTYKILNNYLYRTYKLYHIGFQQQQHITKVYGVDNMINDFRLLLSNTMTGAG